MNKQLRWHEANRILKEYGCYCYQPQLLAMRGQIQVVWMGTSIDRTAPWEVIPCTEAAIHLWLGY